MAQPKLPAWLAGGGSVGATGRVSTEICHAVYPTHAAFPSQKRDFSSAGRFLLPHMGQPLAHIKLKMPDRHADRCSQCAVFRLFVVLLRCWLV